jgi:hypothetical protein
MRSSSHRIGSICRVAAEAFEQLPIERLLSWAWPPLVRLKRLGNRPFAQCPLEPGTFT